MHRGSGSGRCEDDIDDYNLHSFESIKPEEISRNNIIKSLYKREISGSKAGQFERSIQLRMVPNYVTYKQYTLTDIEFDSRVYNSRFIPDGSMLYCTSQHDICIFNTEDPYNWEELRTINGHGIYWTITDVDLSPCQEFLAYSTFGSHITMVNLRDVSADNIYNQPAHNHVQFTCDLSDDHHGFGIFSVKFSGDGRELVAGTTERSINVYDLVARQLVFSVDRAHEDDINSICFADREHSQVIYSGSDDTSIKIWDRRMMGRNQRIPQGVLIGHREGLTHVQSKGDGISLISNSKDQTMKMWDIRKLSSHEQYREFRKTHKYSTNFDYRWNDYPNHNYTKRLSADSSVLTFRGHRVLETLIKCYFSPLRATGQRYVYTGSADGCVYIYDTVSGKLVSRLQPSVDAILGMNHRASGTVRDVSWHPHIPLIATASFNGCINYYQFQHKQFRNQILDQISF